MKIWICLQMTMICLTNLNYKQRIKNMSERKKEWSEYEINILTYGQLDHQTKKIKFSKAMPYINNIIVTSNSKIGLKEIDYQNSIFIDNNPNQIEQLVKYGVKKIFRIRRATDKYSTQKVSNNIKEYPDFLTLVKKELI